MRREVLWAALVLLLAVPALGEVEPATTGTTALLVGSAPVRARHAALLVGDLEGGALNLAAQVLTPIPEGEVRRVPVLVEVSGSALGSEGEETPAPVEIFLYGMGADGSVLDTVTHRVALEGEGRDLLASGVLRLSTALRLPPGDYRVRLLVVGGEEERFGLITVPAADGESGSGTGIAADTAAVVPACDAELLPLPSWCSGEAPPAVVEAAAAAGAAGDRPAGGELEQAPLPSAEELAAGYLEVLSRLAAGEETAALAALEVLERRAVDPESGAPLEVLGEIEWGAFTGRLGADWSAAAAVALFHLRSCESHLRRRRFPQAAHGCHMAQALAEGLAAETGTAASRRFAAGIVSWIADRYREAGGLRAARELCERAHDLDPGDPAPLLALSAIDERVGDLEGARATLERLLVGLPGLPEARLRLAVVLRRSGRQRRPRSILTELTAGAGPEWVVRLATQELARLDLDLDDCAAAAQTLELGRERWPQEAVFAVGLAWARSCLGDRVGARRVLETQESRQREVLDPEGLPDRVRYARWPELVTVARRNELEAEGAAALPALARLFEETGE